MNDAKRTAAAERNVHASGLAIDHRDHAPSAREQRGREVRWSNEKPATITTPPRMKVRNISGTINRS